MVSRVKTEPRILRLLLFILCSAGHVLCVSKSVKVKGSYTFMLNINGKLDSILWKFNNDKVVEFEEGQPKWFQFKPQGALNESNGDLTLKDLKKGNSGVYEAEFQVDGNFRTAKFTLQVKDGVGVPTISCVVDPDGQITLNCSANSVEPVEYDWSGPEGKLKGKTLVTKETKRESVYFCTATNEVDKQSNQFALEECYGPGPASVSIVTVVLVVLIIIFIIFVAVLAFVCREKIKTYLPVSSS